MKGSEMKIVLDEYEVQSMVVLTLKRDGVLPNLAAIDFDYRWFESEEGAVYNLEISLKPKQEPASDASH